MKVANRGKTSLPRITNHAVGLTLSVMFIVSACATPSPEPDTESRAGDSVRSEATQSPESQSPESQPPESQPLESLPLESQPPESLPQESRAPDDSSSRSSPLHESLADQKLWLERSTDRAQLASEQFSLLDVLQKAQSHDANFRMAYSERDIIAANVPIARSDLLPQANVEATSGWFALGDDLANDYRESEFGLSLEQSLYDPSAARQLDGARRGLDAAESRLLASQQALVLKVTQAYFDVLAAQSELAFSKADLSAIGRLLEEVEQQFSVGELPATDVIEARAQRDLAAATEIDATNTLDDAREVLLEYTGLSAFNANLADLDAETFIARPVSKDPEHWVRLALEDNDSLDALRQDALQARQQIAAARAARLPSLSLAGTLGVLDSGNTLEEDGESASVSLTASLPLFTGGLLNANIGQESARGQLAQDRLLEAERSTAREARTALRALVASSRRVDALDVALRSTREAVTAVRAGFDAGTRTTVEVLEAQRDTLRAQTDLDSARYGYVVNKLQLKQIAGTLQADDLREVDDMLEYQRQ